MVGRLVGWASACALAVAIPAGVGAAELPADPTPLVSVGPDATPPRRVPAPSDYAELLPPAPPLRTQTLVHLDWHGSVRARAETMGGMRVNTDNAALPSHFDIRHGSADKPNLTSEGLMSSTDVRVRLEPTLRLGDSAKVHLQLDAAGLLGDDAVEALTASRYGTGALGNNPLHSGLLVRRAWASVRVLGLANVEIGRMPDHFGLGMVRNQGGELDQDLQNDVDRVRVTADVFGFHLSLGRASLASYPMATPGGALANYNGAVAAQVGVVSPAADTLGPGNTGLPVQDSTDVVRWDLGVAGGKLTNDKGLLWEAALLWQSQDYALRLENTQTPDGPTPRQQLSDPNCGADCAMLSNRALRLYTFQGAADWRAVWGGFPLRLQAEGAFQYGTIVRSDITVAADPKTIVAGGAALKARWQRPRGDWLLDAGIATGEADGGFGVTDSTNFKMGGVADGSARSLLTGFRFHRSYRVDGLLFRDVIGAVANAVYLRPAVQWPLVQTKTRSVVLETGLLGAMAASADATPGLGRWIGLEPDVTLRMQLASSQVVGRATFLLPGSALANSGGAAAQPAWRIDAGWRVRF